MSTPIPGLYVEVQKPDGSIVKLWQMDDAAFARACGALPEAKVIDFAAARIRLRS